MGNDKTKRSVDDAVAPRSLDRLLLDEANHRVANEVASALAAMRIAQSSRRKGSRSKFIDDAIDRLEAFGQCSRLFASVPTGHFDVKDLIEAITETMLTSRSDRSLPRVCIDLQSIVVEGETARRTAMIAYELINNALKHAFGTSGGVLQVQLEAVAHGIVLSVIDDGPGLATGSTSAHVDEGLGGYLVRDLVRLSGGHLVCTTGPNGTAIRVMLPAKPFS
jgi:two-component sensor histidine kinase